MTATRIISSIFGIDDFAKYEQEVYEKYQEIAEREIIGKINELLLQSLFLEILKC